MLHHGIRAPLNIQFVRTWFCEAKWFAEKWIWCGKLGDQISIMRWLQGSRRAFNLKYAFNLPKSFQCKLKPFSIVCSLMHFVLHHSYKHLPENEEKAYVESEGSNKLRSQFAMIREFRSNIFMIEIERFGLVFASNIQTEWFDCFKYSIK